MSGPSRRSAWKQAITFIINEYLALIMKGEIVRFVKSAFPEVHVEEFDNSMAGSIKSRLEMFCVALFMQGDVLVAQLSRYRSTRPIYDGGL
jgi:hypothetical protein